MQDPIIEIVPENPSPEDQKSISRALNAFNNLNSGLKDQPDFAILVRDPVSKAVIGGLYGVDEYGWAFVKYLLVPEGYRGQGLGTRLIEAAEDVARERGYIGMWLSTFEFQAKPFYKKMGYEVFGELEGGPGAIPLYFLKKRF